MQLAYMELAKDLTRKKLTPCVVCSLRTKEIVHEDGTVDVFFTCSVLKTRGVHSHFFLKRTKEEKIAFQKANLEIPAHLIDWMPAEVLKKDKVDEKQQPLTDPIPT